ncbi:SAV_2336 N-terminal domain-related protein [Spirillospora sp. CA-142024]|uniref:SAV_2336 N-terminal domain-related protein n=1 Tax=Spirillospora sp. CA-142024 TaxID=3240036 RepID=UPI003D92120E
MSEIERLREALSAVGPPPDARELSEMLWLACHISPAPEQAIPARPVSPPVPDEPADAPGLVPPPTPAPLPASEPLTGLHPRPAAAAEPAGEASEVLVPTAPMLADPLGVQRALRPLKRRVPSRHRRELDEEATAARIADTRLWTPVLVPSPERWLGLSLVVDTGPTMRLWRPLARELADALLRQGAFQDVHVCHLDGTGRIASTPEAPRQDPGTLLDASGRQAVLVLSDCSGPHWWNGRAVHAVRRWAQAGPVAILQPLAERLWRRTAAPTSPGLAVLPRPGAPNTDLRFTPYDGTSGPGVPVPVLEITPRWFGAWARLVSGSDPQPAAVAVLPPRPSGPAPVRREHELPIAERVRRFLATASPDAAELAAHVAVSVPSLPVMRLIQHRVLGGSGPGQLAEVLLSGLLRPIGGVRYEFVPGAREALLDTLPRPEALHTRHVLEAVSAEIERRAGTSAETFRALLPTDGGPVTLAADTDHFALLTPRTRSHLAPSSVPAAAPDLLELLDTPVDELIGDDWDRRPRPTVIGADGDDLVSVDVLHSNPDLPHGLINGPRPARDALLRTLVFSLALSHSPNIVNFAFISSSKMGRPYNDLWNLPHVAVGIPGGPASSPQIGDLPWVLESERIRREAILRSAGVSTWDEYQAAIAGGRPLDPLPALVVIIDNAGPLLEERPDLLAPLVALCDAGPAQGIKFLFCSPNDSLPPSPITGFAGWNIGFPSQRGDHLAFLHIFAQEARPAFEPAHISPDVSAPIMELMRQRGPEAEKLPSPREPTASAPPDSPPPQLDVLALNGGGPGQRFHEVWARPASTPRNPAIGYDTDGNVVSLYPLDASAGIPHGLIVGTPEARQRIVRAITLALAAVHSPADLTFVFAGLGEHPLGEPIDLPHIRSSEEELLGWPEKLQRLFDFLSSELVARASIPSGGLPGASDFGTNEWLVEELYEQYRQDPNSVDQAWWDFFADYQPGDQPAVMPATASPEKPRLLVVADVSLTFPPSRREVGETLLSLAQRGRALGVQLLLTSSTVDNATIWDRFLPLLGWRIAASALRPAELQRVLGQASVPFPDDGRTAYLLAGGGSPHRFTVAEDPPKAAIDDFVRRARDRWQSSALSEGAESLAHLDGMISEIDARTGNERVRAALREILGADAETVRSGGPLAPRHLIFPAPFSPEMSTTAELYGEMLKELGVLPNGDRQFFRLAYGERGFGADPASIVADLFRTNRGSVALVHDRRGQDAETGYLRRETIESLLLVMQYEHDETLMVLCGDPDRFRELRRAIPEFAERFRWISAFEAGPPPHSAGIVPGRRVRLGTDPGTGEPVFIDFETDRHLLISGPYGSWKTRLVRRIVDELALSGTEKDRLVYVLDTRTSPRTLARAEAWVRSGVRFTTSAEEFGTLLSEAIWSARARLLSGKGPEVYVAVAGRDHLLRDDPLAPVLPQLRTMREHGLHLILARNQITLGEPLDPVVPVVRELGGPVLLTSHVGGHEARLWHVPDALHGSLPQGHGLLAHPDRQRLVQLDDLG